MNVTAAAATLGMLFDKRMAVANGRKTFLIVDGKTTDYATMTDRLRRVFALFSQKGLVPGQRMAILSTSVLDVATLMLGGIRYGLGAVNLNPEISTRDCSIALDACAVSHLFVDRAIFERIVVPHGLPVTLIELAGGERSGGGLLGLLRAKPAAASGFSAELARLEPQDAATQPPPDATAMMLFTSGTTSQPKVVELSHKNLSAQLQAFDAVYGYDDTCRILNPLPLHFTDGMLHGPISAFLAGATLVRPTRFDFQKLEDLIHSIYRDRITHFIVVPALLSMIDRLGDAFADAFATRDFRYIRCSGDLLPEKLWRSIEARFKVLVANTYGMSETVCEALYAGPAAETHRIGTIGKPVGCDIRLVADNGEPAAAGATGELQIRGDIIMKGYLNQPQLTAAAFDQGWLRTGDLAALDQDGFVTIVGRKKALIITGGVNVQPQDIVDCLLLHPAISEAAAFGMPHNMWGEQVAAAVCLKPGQTATSHDLVAHCERNLSPHKVPRLVTILPELPRNAAGKVLNDKLRQLARQQDSSAGMVDDTDADEQVRRIAARVFSCKLDDLRPTSEPANTLGWDSFAHLDLVSAVEQHFGVSLSAADLLRIKTLGDLAKLAKTARAA